ncbi:MAG: DsbA family protein [Chitinophagaceae bacterium]|nr:MAG: dithiol-disulfide isomerase [Bacteroidetes bacterium OLB11]MCC6448529.1 DsbA family protein [Chitinophagaceae bacterium]
MKNKNPLICDPTIGSCEVPTQKHLHNHSVDKNQKLAKPITVIYYTDPICSSCWAIEAQLRKMKLEYGDFIQIEYHMGGLLPDWSYNSGGISKPSDVAHHWDEVSVYYDMPIDGEVWLTDPLESSYPPSIAWKAAQIQDEDKAILFLRKLREFVFLDKKNITKWEHISQAASLVGLDTTKLKQDYEQTAKQLFEKDLQLGRELGVRGFPTLIFKNEHQQTVTVYGSKPYQDYINAIHDLMPAVQHKSYNYDWEFLFGQFESLTVKEFAMLSGVERNQAIQQLNELTTKGYLVEKTIKNGSIWYKK